MLAVPFLMFLNMKGGTFWAEDEDKVRVVLLKVYDPVHYLPNDLILFVRNRI